MGIDGGATISTALMNFMPLLSIGLVTLVINLVIIAGVCAISHIRAGNEAHRDRLHPDLS